jgi:hypothetical protein
VVVFSRIWAALGVFLIVVGAAYWLAAYEDEGLVLMVTVAGGAVLIGGYLVAAVRRARVRLAARPVGEARTGADVEPHVTPTIWPLVFAISAIGLIVGAVAERWVLAVGGVVFVAACIGWVVDIRRQWDHHAAADTPHEVAADEPHGPQTE